MINLTDTELRILRSILTERIQNIGIILNGCSIAARNFDEYLYCHFKYELNTLVNLYNKLSSHE